MAVFITFVGQGQNATTLIIMIVGITTFSVMTLYKKSLSVTTFSIRRLNSTIKKRITLQ